MIDPALSLAVNVQSSKGVYALLLGSGISSAAGVPTGWNIVLDLIRKVAHAAGESCEPSPEEWYAATYEREADYAELLNEVGPTAAARQRILRAYFEPTDAEREEGSKLPTAAHHAIAQLVRDGFIRVIVTTNFDRLIEAALDEAGVAPTVISTPDAATGAVPLAHNPCTVVKLHGDYMDTRIKNSPAELAEYDDAINAVLDQVLDEYGLVVCGWSGEYDTALRAAMERARSRRFPTFWSSRGTPRTAAASLISHSGAQVIQGMDADQFFGDLAEKVTSLEEFAQPHPLSGKAAVASTKRYLEDQANEIKLRELVLGEAERVAQIFSQGDLMSGSGLRDRDEFILEYRRRAAAYEIAIETLASMFAIGSFWAREWSIRTQFDAFRTITNMLKPVDGLTGLIDLRLYPAQVLFYAAGVAGVAAENFTVFSPIALTPTIKPPYADGLQSAAALLHPESVMEHNLALQLLETSTSAPASAVVEAAVSPAIKQVLPGDDQVRQNFDLFEYIFSLIYADQVIEKGERPFRTLLGSYAWRRQDEVVAHVDNEIENRQESWFPLLAGFFGGEPVRLARAVNVTKEDLRRPRR